MKAIIDGELCSGHGRCEAMASTVYTLDDNGYCADRGKTIIIKSGSESAARLGAEACPERAITIIED